MIDPSLSLAASVQSNPGVFALLIGSGVSRSSGVPTGWEIVVDLIRKLAKLRGEECGGDPEGWYKTSFREPPSYSSLLNGVAKSSAERMQLLRGYFEPTEAERQEGRKLPTPGHRAIAEFVAKGYFRVLITTNFDRLLESALVNVGIQPMSISTADAAQGALPLAHSRCTVIKLNGDYLDIRLKNTSDELAQYEGPVERLLRQVFDEYGLLVCGWSGESDTALRGALERCSTRRFTTYWATREKLIGRAQDLASLCQASVLSIVGADEFFGELRDKVFALEDMATADSLSAKVAVARMKRYIADPSQRISLHNLVTSETEKAYAQLTGPRFPAIPPDLSPNDIGVLLKSYEGVVEVVLRLLVCGAYWGEAEQDALLLRCFTRMTDQTSFQSTQDALAGLRLYPSLVLLYGAGIAALSRHNYRIVRSLFGLKVKYDAYKPGKTVAAAIHDQAVLERELQKQVLGNRRTPLSDHLFGILRDALREYLRSDDEYDQTFDWFEYLLCLCHCDAKVSRSELKELEAREANFTLSASIGRFGWNTHGDGEPNIQAETELIPNQPLPDKVAAVLRAGFFGSGGQLQQDDKYREVKAAFDRHVENVRSQWGGVW